jgi:hypothetical protein
VHCACESVDVVTKHTQAVVAWLTEQPAHPSGGVIVINVHFHRLEAVAADAATVVLNLPESLNGLGREVVLEPEFARSGS